jgi:transcriptional regulator with XRE-family HTH domain
MIHQTIDTIARKQKETIATLTRKGCSISEVATALGFTQYQLTQILEEESHPFNVVYWNAKVEYTQRLRDFALDIAEHSEDASVRAKMVEFLAKENSEAFEHKRLHTGYTNIRKLLSLVRQQFIDEKGKIQHTKRPYQRRNRNVKEIVHEQNDS